MRDGKTGWCFPAALKGSAGPRSVLDMEPFVTLCSASVQCQHSGGSRTARNAKACFMVNSLVNCYLAEESLTGSAKSETDCGGVPAPPVARCRLRTRAPPTGGFAQKPCRARANTMLVLAHQGWL